MPLRASDVQRMKELTDSGTNNLRRIESFLLDKGYQDQEGIWDWINVIEQVLLEMPKLQAPIIHAAERAAEEYHQLREELEEEYTSGNYRPA
jgi:hypothetical protein